jgi:hypothetical protein
VTENHRVLEAVGGYLGRWDVKVSTYEEGREITRATVQVGIHARKVVGSFRGVAGAVAVVAEEVGKPGEVVFSWLTRRG